MSQIQLVRQEAKDTLEVEARAFIWMMPKVIGAAYRQIGSLLEAQGLKPSGMPYVRYLDIDWEQTARQSRWVMLLSMMVKRWHMVIGMPVPRPLEGSGPVRPGTMPAGQYVKAFHTGPYRKMGDTYNRMMAWTKEQGFTMKPESVEIYLNGPEDTPEAKLETEVLIPLV